MNETAHLFSGKDPHHTIDSRIEYRLSGVETNSVTLKNGRVITVQQPFALRPGNRLRMVETIVVTDLGHDRRTVQINYLDGGSDVITE